MIKRFEYVALYFLLILYYIGRKVVIDMAARKGEVLLETHDIENGLHIVAADFRQAIILTDCSLRPVTMRNFPRGACGTTSRMLGYHFDRLGIGECRSVLGYHDVFNEKYGEIINYSHNWLELYGLAIDITGSQFDFIHNEITICAAKRHRDRFKRCVDAPYWKEYDGEIICGKKRLENDRLWPHYCEIIKHCKISSLDEI